jgi:predicted transcriptional regulator with HTH domain
VTFYEFFSDPTWQSAGAILGAAGVFAGAWLGAKFGYKHTLKLQQKQLLDSKETFLKMALDEIHFNRATLTRIESYITKNPPIENCLDAADIGTQHIRYNAWNVLVESGVLAILSKNQQQFFQITIQETKNIVQTIQLEVAEWKRVYAFHAYYKANPSKELMQPLGNLQDILNTTIHNLQQDLKRVVNNLEEAKMMISSEEGLA